MIGVIGLGGAGGNIAEEAQKAGFLSAAINFSQKDLDAVDVKHKLRLTGSEGVGKNRNIAIELFQQQWETALGFVYDIFSNVDMIIFAFSSAGGSGSGIAPILIDIITSNMVDKVVVAIPILPDSSEATVSQSNALNTFNDLSSLPISIFPIDNNESRKMHKAKNKMFDATNTEIIRLLRKVSNYTEKNSKNGNFDKRDLLTVFDTHGIGLITEVDMMALGSNFELSTSRFTEKIIDSWSNTSLFIRPELKQVTRAAMIFDGQTDLIGYLDYKSCFDHFESGLPIDLFEGYYQESKGKVITILTGLSWCNKRLHDIEQSIERDRDKVVSMLSEPIQHKTKVKDVLDMIQQTPKKQNVSDILAKYKR